MLLKLLPEQLDKFWPYVKYALEHSFPEGHMQTAAVLNSVLQELLVNKMQAWIYVKDEDKILCLVITSVIEDSIVGNILRLYCVYSFESLPEEAWAVGWETILAFAQATSCVRIEAFTTNKNVAALASKFGFKYETYIYKEI